MARTAVDPIASGMMVVRKTVKKDLGGGSLGLTQIRRVRNVVVSPRLRRINSCMAGKLGGKTFGNLGAVQKAFKEARGACRL